MTKEFDFRRDAHVSLWGYNLRAGQTEDDSEEGTPPVPREELRDEDLDKLEAFVADVRSTVAFDLKQREQTLRTLQTQTGMRCTRLRRMGCKILRDKQDGPYADVVVEPPLDVLLNLCGTFLDSVDVMWMLIRRGMGEVRPSEKRGMHCPVCSLEWKSNPSDCRVCLCETTNIIVHVACWKAHLRTQTLRCPWATI